MCRGNVSHSVRLGIWTKSLSLLARQRASLQQRKTCNKLKLGQAAKEQYKSFAQALGSKVRKVRAQLELRAGTCRVTNILITKKSRENTGQLVDGGDNLVIDGMEKTEVPLSLPKQNLFPDLYVNQ